MQKISCLEVFSEPLDSDRDDVREQWGDVNIEKQYRDLAENNIYNKNIIGNQPEELIVRKLIKHRYSLQIDPRHKISEEIENKQNQKIFALDDESEGLTPPESIQIQVSELSQQELFSPKNLIEPQPNMDISFPSPLDSKSSNTTQNGTSSFYILPEFKLNQQITLSRRQKVLRYLRKKHNRTFKKKISYHCRKTVAQSRLRVKGRFITRSVAESLLQKDLSRLCNSQIKLLLQRLLPH